VRFYTNVQMVGNDILIRGYENGEKYIAKEQYSPTLYVKSKRDSGWKTLSGENVEPIKPGTIRDCRDFYKKYDGIDGFQIFGNERYTYQYISDKYPEDEIQFDISKIDLITLDIETQTEYGFPDPQECREELLCISIQKASTKEVITWGRKPFTVKQKNVTYIYHKEEVDMLNSFINWWSQNYPDVITGWNCRLFDIPYLCGRIERVCGNRKMRELSPWTIVTNEETWVAGRKFIVFDIAGLTTIDYLDLYKKFTFVNRESYRLDFIAEVELGQKKLDHSEFNTFKDFYTGDWQKFVEYNIVDVELVDRLEDKLKLIDLIITMAFDAKVNFGDPMFQVRLWDTIIYNYLKKRKIVIPQKDKSDKDNKFAGAYVKEPDPGVYEWVVSFDLNSLYPHLIMQYNISPETLLEDKHPSVNIDKILDQSINFELYKDYAVCANGAMYRKDEEGFLPKLMKKMYAERKAFKKQMLKSKQKLVDIESEMKRRGIK